MIYFIIWVVFSFMWILIFPVEYMINKMDDKGLLKKWWRDNVIGLDPKLKKSKDDNVE
jgi:hypothetical protein